MLFTFVLPPRASRIACNAARRVPTAGRMLSSSSAARGPAAVLPDLTYDYGELEPAISGEIMKIHHTKHHQVCSIKRPEMTQEFGAEARLTRVVKRVK